MVINILTSGDMKFIYDDDLREIVDHGKAKISRASHVEPNDSAEFTADLSPVGGPILGPFPLRQTALDAEVTWIENNFL